MMNFLTQIYALSALGIRSARQRPSTTSMIIIAFSMVIAVLLSMLTLTDSLDRAITSGSRPDRAIVLSQGAALEMQSVIRRPSLAAIESAPGIRKDARGKPIASVELLGRVRLRERSRSERTIASIRGVSPNAFALRPELRLLEGRMITSGLHELLVGRAAQNRYLGLNVGDIVTIRDSPWTVVGVFSAPGSKRESELLADTETLAAAYNKSAFQSVWVQMESSSTIDSIRTYLATDKSLGVEVTPEPDYTQRESAAATKLFRVLATLISIVMAAAAAFGVATMMHAAVSDRTREIATLRALGFSSSAVIISILVEVLTLALVGAIVGAAFAAIILDGAAFHSSFINVRLQLSTSLTLAGLACACAMGLLSGLLPAFQVARTPVSTALRAI